jgi:hypothetical protein
MTDTAFQKNERISLYNGPRTLLRPRPEMMRAWLNYWFEFVAGSIEIAWRDPATKKITNAAHFDIRDPTLEKYAANVNAVEGQDTYFTPSVVRNGRGRAKDSDFVCSPGFWLDQDKEADVDFAKSVQHEFYPTSFVYTGRTPEPRRQCWFRLDEPVTDYNLVRETNAKLVDLYKGDPSVVNPARLMRLPGSIAYPWKLGRIPELVSWDHPQDQRSQSHPFSLIQTIPQAVPTLIEQRPKGAFPGVEELINRIKAGDHWHNNMVQLVGHWVARGLSDSEILVWADQFTLPGYTLDQTIDEIQTAINGGRRAWDIPNVDHEAKTGLQVAREIFSPIDLPIAATDQKNSKPRDLKWMAGADLPPQEILMLIEDFIECRAISIIYGAYETGKTTLAVDMIFHVAHGIPWCGRNVMRCGVLIIELEGEAGLCARIQAWHAYHDVAYDGAAVFSSCDSVSLDRKEDVQSIIELIGRTNALCKLPVQWLVIDTLARARGGLDEDRASDMGKIINAAQDIIEATGVAITILHHPGKDAARGPRGSSSLTSDVNTVIEVQKSNAGLIEVKIIKQKNTGERGSLFFNFKSIELGYSAKGKRIVASTVVQTNASKAVLSKANIGSGRYAAEVAIFGGAINGSITFKDALEKFNSEYSGKAGTTGASRLRAFRREVDALKRSNRIISDGQAIRIIGGGVAGVFSPITATPET